MRASFIFSEKLVLDCFLERKFLVRSKVTSNVENTFTKNHFAGDIFMFLKVIEI